MPDTAEGARLDAAAQRQTNWQRWGPYLPERQWATVREDRTAGADPWAAFSYEHSAGRAYRWGEDGLLGLTDRECRLCLAPVLWNGADDHLKERLFGLTNGEGNHGEDVKEVYFYLDATPTASYLKALYKYPQSAFPYEALRREGARRTKADGEYELTDSGAFDGDRYFDVFVEVAKAGPDDLLVKYTAHNRGPDAATLHLLPTLWFRNTWAWGAAYEEGRWAKPAIRRADESSVTATHETLGEYRLSVDPAPAEWLFTENETDPAVDGGTTLGALGRAVGLGGGAYKNAFHDRIVRGKSGAESRDSGTKAAAVHKLDIPAGGSAEVRVRLASGEAEAPATPFGNDFDAVVRQQRKPPRPTSSTPPRFPRSASADERCASFSARRTAGLRLVEAVLPLRDVRLAHRRRRSRASPSPGYSEAARAAQPRLGRTSLRATFFSMPDKWEYPWFASWDSRVPVRLPMSRIDRRRVRQAPAAVVPDARLVHAPQRPDCPAYEYSTSAMSIPPVHAWACWRVYKLTGARRTARRAASWSAAFQLLMNFTWWVNRQATPKASNIVSAADFWAWTTSGFSTAAMPLPSAAGYSAGAGGRHRLDGVLLHSDTDARWPCDLALNEPRSTTDIASKFFAHFIADRRAPSIGSWAAWGCGTRRTNSSATSTAKVPKATTPFPCGSCASLVGLIPLLRVSR